MDIVKKFTHKDSIRKALLRILEYPPMERPLLEVYFLDDTLGLNGNNIAIGYLIGYNVDLDLVFWDSISDRTHKVGINDITGVVIYNHKPSKDTILNFNLMDTYRNIKLTYFMFCFLTIYVYNGSWC